MTNLSESIKLKRSYHAALKNDACSISADFAPLWQLAGGVGAAAGALKGGTEQNPDGTQIGLGERLTKVGTNALAGGVLGGAVGAGIPQLAKESPSVLAGLDDVRRSTGVNVLPDQLPMSGHARRLATREAAKQSKRAALQTLQGKVLNAPVVRTPLEIAQTGIHDVNKYVVNPIKAVPGAIKNVATKADEVADVVLRSPAQRQRRAILKDTEILKGQILKDQTSRARYDLASGKIQLAPDGSGIQVLNSTGAVKTAADGTPILTNKYAPEIVQSLHKEAINDSRNLPTKLIKGTWENGQATRRAVDTGIAKVAEGTNNVKGFLGRLGRGLKTVDERSRAAVNDKFGTRFSQDSMNAEFEGPYITGAKTGGVVGAGIGATLGLAKGLDKAALEDENQLKQIQSIQDPYARKKEWDLYSSDTSTLGRQVSGVVNAGVGAATGAVAGGVGGALLGGAGLAGYTDVVNGASRPLKKRVRSFSLSASSIGAGVGSALGAGGSAYLLNQERPEGISDSEHTANLATGAVGGALLGGVVGYRSGQTVADAKNLGVKLKDMYVKRGMSQGPIPIEDKRGAIPVPFTAVPKKGLFNSAAVIGAGLGTLKGSMDQPMRQRINPDGTISPDRYSPSERLGVLALNAGVGAGVGTAVSNIPARKVGNLLGRAKKSSTQGIQDVYGKVKDYIPEVELYNT